jgi:hypothetical protein
LISQLAFDEQMQLAAMNRNESRYDDAKHLSLLKTISTFKDADMLDVLEEYIDSASNDLSDEDLKVIKQALNESEIEGKSDDEIRQRIKEESAQIKNIISDYVKVNDDLKFALSSTATQLDINTMGEILSLSQHKMSIAQKLMDENKQFFQGLKEDATDNEKLAYILNYLEFDTKEFDLYESLPKDTRDALIEKKYRRFVRKNRANKFTKNALEDRQLWDSMMRIFNEIYQGVQLNNEFSVLFENPQLLHEVRKSLFDEHLNEEEKKAVKERVNKFKNAQNIDELEQLYSELKDDDVSTKIKDQLHRIGDSEILKNYLKYKDEEKAWYNILTTINSLSPNKTEDDKKFKDIVKELRKLNYHDGLLRLQEIWSDQTKYSKELVGKINNLRNAFKESINFLTTKETHQEEQKKAADTEKKKEDNGTTQPKQQTGNFSNEILNEMFAVNSPLRNNSADPNHVTDVNFTEKDGDYRLYSQLNNNIDKDFVAYIYANISRNIVQLKIVNKSTREHKTFVLNESTCNPSESIEKIELSKEQQLQISDLFKNDQAVFK